MLKAGDFLWPSQLLHEKASALNQQARRPIAGLAWLLLPWLNLGPLSLSVYSSDTHYQPPSGSECHQRHQGIYDLWSNQWPQCSSQVCGSFCSSWGDTHVWRAGRIDGNGTYLSSTRWGSGKGHANGQRCTDTKWSKQIISSLLRHQCENSLSSWIKCSAFIIMGHHYGFKHFHVWMDRASFEPMLSLG